VRTRPRGPDVRIAIRGANLAPGAVVRINGEAVAVPVSFSRGALRLRGDAEALRLNPDGQRNALVVEVDGLASAEAEF
jgi:hypothetical protein